ncbi:MAG: DUF4360 domain-containing protein, partial [Pseudobdellovibrionaceae bacterium]
IRASFIQVGEAVIEFLQTTQQGAAIVKNANLNVHDLEKTLDIEKISVADGNLRDNSGSLVEAIGEPHSIKLQKEAWFNHFEKNHDIFYLVFHEMLRSASVNDDNYRISASLNPFPMSLRFPTKVVPLLPLIKEDLLTPIFDLKKVAVNGSGCSQNAAGTRVEFNEETNILQIETRNFKNELSQSKKMDRKQCGLSIPVVLPAKKQLVISQIDLRAKVDLRAKSQTQIAFEAFLAGSSNTLKTRTVKAQQNLNGRVQVRRTEVLKSACGGADTIRLSATLLTNSNGLALESAQIDETLLYMSLQDCL